MTNEPTVEAFRPSPQQEAQWLAHPDGPPGRTQAIVRVEGPVDTSAVAAGLARAVERHEILRTTFAPRPGIRTPLQFVHEDLPPEWKSVELGDTPETEAAQGIDDLLEAELRAPMDLQSGPLVRGLFVSLGG